VHNIHLHHHILHKYIEIHYNDDNDNDDNIFSLTIKANKMHYFSTLFW